MKQNFEPIFNELQTEIDNFPGQFAWQATIENANQLPENPQNIAVCGMGGSALAANLLLAHPLVPNIRIHRDYWHNWLADMDLIVVSSFSGNTEEMIDVLEHARKHSIPVTISTNGGELLELAQQHKLAHVQLPDALQPRYAIGYSYVALSELVLSPLSKSSGQALSEISANTDTFTTIANQIAGRQVVYYSTAQNFSIAYVWKILTNETAKQMAWANKLPEFNHNELNGYFTANRFSLDKNLAVVIFISADDHPRNKKRIEIISGQIADKGIEVVVIDLGEMNTLEKAVYGWHAGMIATLELARHNNVDPKAVDIIEDLKKKLKK